MELIETYKYIHSKNICNEKELKNIEEGTAAYDEILGKLKNEDLFDDIPCVVDYINRKAEQKRNMEKRKNNLVNAISDDNWGNPGSMEHDFSIEEILDMPTESEVQMNLPLANIDYVRHDDLCKVVFPNNSETPKQDTISSKTDDININESHGRKIGYELFGVTEKDLELIDMDSIFDDKIVM